MTIYNGTDGDDDIVIQTGTPEDIFNGGDGIDTIVIEASFLPDGSFGFGEYTVFNSIEAVRVDMTNASLEGATFALSNNPFTNDGASLIADDTGFFSVRFTVGTQGGTFIVPDITLVNWDSPLGSNVIGISAVGSSFDTTLLANESVDSVQQLIGGNGNDTLVGHSGRDIFSTILGNDTMLGQGGDDLFFVANSLGTNINHQGSSIDGGDGEDTLLISAFAIDPNPNYLYAPQITDVEHIQFGGAPINGVKFEARFETSLHADFASSVNVLGTESGLITIELDDRDQFDASGITFQNHTFEDEEVVSDNDVTVQIVGNTNDNLLIGTERGDILLGKDGNDTLFGLGGNDELRGGFGDVTLVGGTGDDTYFLDNGTHVIFENADEGIDTVIAQEGTYLYANVENLILAEFSGDDFGVGNAGDNTIDGNEGSNLLIGGAGNDFLNGNDGVDSLFGEAGEDWLNGGAGIDYLVGGADDDTLFGGDDADAIYGGQGNDYLVGGDDFATDILVGGDGEDQLLGNSGLGDFDLMDGGAGNDTYLVDTGDDLTFEGVNGGIDTVIADIQGVNTGVYLYANVENLVLENDTAFGVGNELDNQITGGVAANTLLGGAGNDTINGGDGNDVLFGEAGADTFVFGIATGGDVIGDFTSGEDAIDISDFGFESFAALQTTFVQNGDVGAINLGTGDFIVLHNVQMDQLVEGDFLI